MVLITGAAVHGLASLWVICCGYVLEATEDLILKSGRNASRKKAVVEMNFGK